MVTLEEMKQYLRVDTSDDDGLLDTLIRSAEKLCADVARIPLEEYQTSENENARTAVLYTVAYLYEHREDADHRKLTVDLRHLLFGIRREGF